MRDVYHQQLDDLVDQLADMCDRVGTAVRGATTALLTADVAGAERVVAGDREVDDDRARIERLAQVLLALHAPVATDLRTIVTIVRSAENIERMGDLAHHVAVAVLRRHPEPVVPDLLHARFRQMGELAFGLAVAAGATLRAHDLVLTGGLREAETEMDDLHRSLFTIVGRPEWTFGTIPAVEAVLLSRYYERFADHAVSVTRRAAFITGDPVEYAAR
ncbi:PhoU domain-containing protein [Amycolatopsis sp. GM8]|uniref:phosphate signaling complex PhoU family protein n=1 Tax=Amycolatopsis sp. GM8 TaxID=2896530 RepID=UPI001F15E942|nr:PhoU domain-containing protein [Amycolatopsis sp. GM8]